MQKSLAKTNGSPLKVTPSVAIESISTPLTSPQEPNMVILS